MDKVDPVFRPNIGFMCTEGPFYDKESGNLFYADIVRQVVGRWNTFTNKTEEVKLGGPVPFVVLDKSGNCVCAVGQQIIRFNFDNPTRKEVIAKVDQEEGKKDKTRINDGKCDSKGRLWCGTMGLEDPNNVTSVPEGFGSLYCIDKVYGENGVVKTKDTGIDLANGIDWSHDKKRMYFVDSAKRVIYAYPFDEATGTVGKRRAVFEPGNTPLDSDEWPDGITTDLKGNIWLACYNSVNRIYCIKPLIDPGLQSDQKPTYHLEKVVEMPVKSPTSLCFGGPNYEALYVTSSNENDTHILAGSIFKIPVSVTGARGSAANKFGF